MAHDVFARDNPKRKYLLRLFESVDLRWFLRITFYAMTICLTINVLMCATSGFSFWGVSTFNGGRFGGGYISLIVVTVLYLVTEHTRRKNEIICTRAHKMKFEGGQLLPYKSWDYETKDTQNASYYLIATGVGGVLYPSGILPKYAFNKEKIKELCFLADDIWLKAVEIKARKKIYAIPSSKTKYVVGIWRSELVALNHMNVGENRNDDYIKKVFSFFEITEKDFYE